LLEQQGSSSTAGAPARTGEAVPSAPTFMAGKRSGDPAPGSSYDDIYAVVARIPRGRVATYGQVALLAGRPRQARLVGYALHALPAGSPVPWHRVVNAAGRISLRGGALGFEDVQARLLAREGIRFAAGAIPLARYRWVPRAAPARAKQGLSRRAKRAIKRR
jgi:methylated-DNA-protein-cysteine methyltransferase-like protein